MGLKAEYKNDRYKIQAHKKNAFVPLFEVSTTPGEEQ
jgi:hypothetical protein